jgi:DNA end-binding protein Ku
MIIRSMWSGTLGVATLVLPVKLGTAVTDDSLELHQVRKSDGSRIRFRRVAQADGEEVAYSDIAKGYELPNGSMVILEDKDFELAFGDKSRAAKVLLFTDPAQVPRTAHAASYYVQPGTGGEPAYELLAEAMLRTGKAAVVSIAVRQREALALLYTTGDGYLILERLQWAAAVKKPDFAAPSAGVTAAELDLAENLVTQMTKPFDWADYADLSDVKLTAVVQAKAETGQVTGTPATRPEGSPTAASDLTATLLASVEQAKSAARPAKPVRRARTRKEPVSA